MHEEMRTVETDAGSMQTFLVRPEAAGPYAPVVLFMLSQTS